MAAELLTVSRAFVDVSTVFVGNATLTTNLYRQIPHGRLYARDEDGRPTDLVGRLWGWVNLCVTPACGFASEHVHVIGDVDGRLAVDVVPGWFQDLEALRQDLPQIYLGD